MEAIYNKIGDTMEKLFTIMIGIGAIVCLIIVNVAVVARLTNVSISWSDELIKIIFIYVIYIGAAIAYKTDSLISITMLEESLLAKTNNVPYKILKVTQHLICTGFAIFCSIEGINMVMNQLRNNELTPALELPAAISTIGFVIGVIAWSYYGFGKIAKYIR
ncbi:hypothetical protein AN639_00300 [Candidatus Epulonipiscium fishelsonii]|uniref:Uncharacterized protein n=1 Tax=Candidatus Epulonipiscium fishelsonii TaxID=77094 RepID=A0ACC8XD03_9FIRM|nr:hypothetical protein AN396_05475 [Epulopiscium sp. SCG-B11WGA-EpuloA1]ONI41826.1 hypothetical protein AN639_00300 [Epulopiscium sp. SCG-B05WGA-EpuloA1]ONI47776.1 hypothetical protein AN644_03955 [Epulopiscium sp. SCG-C06WGA-EpuloA1]